MFLRALPFIALYTLFISGNGHSQETMIQTLSEGACWFEQGENLKIVSFNDHEAISVPREGLEESLNGLLSKKKREEMELFLHCSAHGVSLVVKTSETCAWIGFEKGAPVLRSVGGNEDVKRSGICDGHKQGEMIIGLLGDDESTLHNLNFYIENFKKVSVNVYRVTLKKEFFGREKELINEFKKTEKNIRYVELNQFQHPVGDYAQLK